MTPIALGCSCAATFESCSYSTNLTKGFQPLRALRPAQLQACLPVPVSCLYRQYTGLQNVALEQRQFLLHLVAQLSFGMPGQHFPLRYLLLNSNLGSQRSWHSDLFVGVCFVCGAHPEILAPPVRVARFGPTAAGSIGALPALSQRIGNPRLGWRLPARTPLLPVNPAERWREEQRPQSAGDKLGI